MMSPYRKPLPGDVQSTASKIYDLLHLFGTMPATFVKTFLAVAKDEGQHVDHYARVVGCSNGSMSNRIATLGESGTRKHEPGYGLLEAAENPDDRRFTLVRLSEAGRALAERLAGMMGAAQQTS